MKEQKEKKIICELCGKKVATQSDGCQSMWLCDDCACKLWNMVDDYQSGNDKDYERLDNYLKAKSFKKMFNLFN